MPLVCLVYTSMRMFTYEEIKRMKKKRVETTEEKKNKSVNGVGEWLTKPVRRWLGSEEHRLLFQGNRVQFLAPTIMTAHTAF